MLVYYKLFKISIVISKILNYFGLLNYTPIGQKSSVTIGLFDLNSISSFFNKDS